MKLIGNIIIFLALYIVFQASGLSGHSGFTLWGFLQAMVIAIPLLLLGAWLVDKHEEVTQTTEEQGAKNVTGGFFLYLRPFESTNAYRLSDAHLTLFSWELYERDGFDDIERLLARALRPTGKFVALGKPGEHRGALRILTTENEWQSEVTRLAESAQLIILMPSHKPGTLWEIALLKKRCLFGKTICVMPPSDNSNYVTDEPNVQAEWSKTQTECSRMGIPLPEYSPAGALFSVDPVVNKFLWESLPPPNPVRWMEAIQRLIDSRHEVLMKSVEC